MSWPRCRCDLRAFLAHEQTRRPAPSSQARTVAALRCFFRFCVESEELDRDPAQVLRTPKKREALPDILDRRELVRLLDMPARPGVWQRVHAGTAQRDRLALALFAYSGLRPAELLALEWDDVDRAASSACARPRAVASASSRSTRAHPLFAAYLARRTPLREPALFVGVQGRRLTATILAQTFRRYADAAGVSQRKRITPHTLRHVFASELLNAGANLRQIQELLGHKHLDSTQRYTRVTAHQLRGAVKRLHWQ
jgi:integrase/recombinase XerC